MNYILIGILCVLTVMFILLFKNKLDINITNNIHEHKLIVFGDKENIFREFKQLTWWKVLVIVLFIIVFILIGMLYLKL